MLGACSFHPGHAAPGDGAALPADATADGALDAHVWPGCLGRWHDHSVHFTSPQLLASTNAANAIDTQYTERDPFLSHDELTLWFSSDRPGSSGGGDVWRSK